MILVYVEAACSGSFSEQKLSPLDQNNNGFFRTRLLEAVFSHILCMLRLTKSIVDSLLQCYKSVEVMPGKMIYEGYTNAFKEVKSKVPNVNLLLKSHIYDL